MAKSGSTMASGTQWNARSHAAYHGYSHVSGIEMTSWLIMWNHAWLRAPTFSGWRSGWARCSCNHTSTSK